VGFTSVYALPMRRRNEIIGALTLFDVQPGGLDADTVQLGQALSEAATIGLLHLQAIRQREALIDQLQTALNSRIVIEQAKGVIAERRDIDIDESFAVLRGIARTSNRRLPDVARAVVKGSEPLDRPLPGGHPRRKDPGAGYRIS
jgi:hypothetical protein